MSGGMPEESGHCLLEQIVTISVYLIEIDFVIKLKKFIIVQVKTCSVVPISFMSSV